MENLPIFRFPMTRTIFGPKPTSRFTFVFEHVLWAKVFQRHFIPTFHTFVYKSDIQSIMRINCGMVCIVFYSCKTISCVRMNIGIVARLLNGITYKIKPIIWWFLRWLGKKYVFNRIYYYFYYKLTIQTVLHKDS